MKESIFEVASNFVNQVWKRSVTQNAPQVMATDKSDEFLGKLGISWLPYVAKGFYLNSKQVKILNDPRSFYDLILEKIRRANDRIVLASLYLGTGSLEKSLIAALNERLFDKPNLDVKILLDCMRGSRGEFNSRKMLLPLLEMHEGSCQVSLYRTPVLRGPLESLMPERYKEIVGLQHMKVYLFDNDLIISGANLSSEYFTNRQDRYVEISGSKDLTDFVAGLVDRVSEFSLHLDSEDKLHVHPTWTHHPVKSKMRSFAKEARSRLGGYYKDFACNSAPPRDFDTVVFPLIEMGPFDIHVDSSVTTKILEGCGEAANVFLTTGYFNITDLYADTIINKSKARFDVLTAHPTANGFYKAEGPARGIPFAYTDLADRFVKNVNLARQGHRINMYEYVRPGCTYHAKGLWLATSDDDLPFLTMIGSPNFGERSVKRDLECQFLIATESRELRRKFRDEKELLFATCQSFTASTTTTESDRMPPLWVKIVVLLFRTFL